MVAPILVAHVFVVCRGVQWDGSAGPNTSRTLEEVAYTYRTDSPDGFAYETEFWLFVRLAHTRESGSSAKNSRFLSCGMTTRSCGLKYGPATSKPRRSGRPSRSATLPRACQ